MLINAVSVEGKQPLFKPLTNLLKTKLQNTITAEMPSSLIPSHLLQRLLPTASCKLCCALEKGLPLDAEQQCKMYLQ